MLPVRSRSFALSVCLLLELLFWAAGQAQDDRKDAPKRVLSEILGIFTPTREASFRDADITTASSFLPPYNLNKAWVSPFGGVSGGEAAMDGASAPDATKNHKHPPMLEIARELMGLFGQELTPAPPSTTPAPSSFFERISRQLWPKRNAETAIPTMVTPFPTLPNFSFPPNAFTIPPSFMVRQPHVSGSHDEESDSFVKKLKGIFEAKAPTTEIDTGGRGFDRLVIRENEGGSDPLSLLGIGGKWNERGLQWDNGHLRLVNKKGNTLFGGEFQVHDQSLDIPLERWFSLANDFAKLYYSQQRRNH